MSKSKRGSGADPIYTTHLFGSANQFNANPAQQRESMIANMLGRKLTDIAMNRFKWDGLPEGMNQRFIETVLFYNALSVVYWDNSFDKLLALRGSGIGYSTIFDDPVSFTVIAPGNGDAQYGPNITLSAYDPARHKDISIDEKRKKAIPIWANYARQPDIDIVQIYATRLATIERTLEINTRNARRNKYLVGTPQTQLSIINVARSIDQGEDNFMVTAPLQDLDSVQTVDLGILPDSYEKLALLRSRWWNECMGLLGIDNSNQDKKERLVSDEVAANDAQTDSMRFVNLQARQYACEQINDVFGTEISVDYNTEIEAQKQIEEARNAAMSLNQSKASSNKSEKDDE